MLTIQFSALYPTLEAHHGLSIQSPISGKSSNNNNHSSKMLLCCHGHNSSTTATSHYEVVGLVTDVNVSTTQMVVRKFLSWEQLVQEVPQASIDGISFWPRSRKPPLFLCDTDFVTEIRAADVVSIAFVFYEGGNRLRELLGVKDTYCVSSCYYSCSHTFQHHCSFFSFPSCGRKVRAYTYRHVFLQ